MSNINSVDINEKVYVSGIVDFSRIAAPLTAEELAADNARKSARGMRTVDKPYTHMTISHAVVAYTNPNAPTAAEQYITEKLYNTKHAEKGLCFTALNKSRNLPAVYSRENAQSKELEPVSLEGELRPGTPVTVMIRFFSTNQNKGMSLDTVIVNERPVRYFGSTSSESALAEHGFTIVPPTNDTDVDAVRDQVQANNAQPTPAPAAPTAAPYAAPAPVPAAPAPAPAAPTPVPAPAPTPAPAPAPTNNLPIPPAGYMYDANNRLVPIGAARGIQL